MADAAVEDLPPIPADVYDIRRVDHTRLRRRLLYSQHERDLLKLLEDQLGAVRSDAWGKPDLTANPYLSLWSQISVLYNAEPHVMCPEGSEELAEKVADAGFWPLMQRGQRDTLALREMLVRVDASKEDGLSFRLVFPDMVECEAHPRQPHIPVRVQEWMQHKGAWVLHDVNIADPANPYYKVWASDRKTDVTKDVLGETYDGGDYPYRDSDDNPILPYVLYHAAQTGCLFDPFTLREVVEGSLNIGLYLTYYGHIVRNAAWAQRWGIDVEPVGMSLEHLDGSESRNEVVGDPATLLRLRGADNAANPQVGTFQNPVDPEAVLRSIAMYERRILMIANVQPPDVTRQEADVRSGYSLAVARESIREAQAVYEPQFRQGDQAVFRVAACLLNRFAGTAYSEATRAYRFAYKGLPKSPVEEKLEAEMLKAEVDAKRLGPVSAYMRRYPGATYEEAVKSLAKAQVEELAVAAAVRDLRAMLGFEESPPPPPKPERATEPANDSEERPAA